MPDGAPINEAADLDGTTKGLLEIKSDRSASQIDRLSAT